MQRYRYSPGRTGLIFLLLAFTWAVRADFQGASHMMPFDEDTINYSKRQENGPVSRLQQRIHSGEVKLPFDPALGYLPGLLRELGISKTSQMLVFSKTSFQRERISPQ